MQWFPKLEFLFAKVFVFLWDVGIDGGEMSQKEVLAETQAEVLAQTSKGPQKAMM